MPAQLFVVIVSIFVFFGIAAARIAENRGASGFLWFILGMLFGPIGLACAFGAGTLQRCPTCKRRNHPEALKCAYCQTDLTELIYACSECEAENKKDAQLCSNCGVPFDPPTNGKGKRGSRDLRHSAATYNRGQRKHS